MPRDNVDLFLKLIETLNGMDVEGALEFMDPEIRFEHRLVELQGSYAGPEAVRRGFADVLDHFEAMRIDCPEIRDLGDRVLALGTTHATGRGSGVETALPFTVVATFRDGRITEFTDFGDKDQALEAVGLSE